MINIEKQKRSERFQKESTMSVEEAYAYGMDLYAGSESWTLVKNSLIRRGVNPNVVEAIVDELKRREKESKKIAGEKEIKKGLVCLIVGVVLTAVTGGVIIFVGAIIWGLWLIIEGVVLTSNS